MAEKNWTHLFIDGRRVSFDRRDGSVTLYPDEGFDPLVAYPLGHAEGFGNDWTATAPDGTVYRARGRKDAAIWLIETTAEEREQHERERAQQADDDDLACEEATAIIRTVWPDFQKPGPFLGNPNAQPLFIFEPCRMRDLLVALTGEGPRELPLAAALARVAEHTVVIFSVRDPVAGPHAVEWGYLDEVHVEDPPDSRPDLETYAEFYFLRKDGEESMIGLPGLASTALVTEDAVTVEEEGGALVIAIAEPAPDMLNVGDMVVPWEWDRQSIIDLAEGEPPAHDVEER
jgi:hypothetical protein